MLKVEIKVENRDRVEKILDSVDVKSQRIILRKTVNDTARELLKHVRSEMPKYIDRPKRITLNSFYAKFASGNETEASLDFRKNLGKKAVTQHWLYALVFGGSRRDKALEAALRRGGILPNGFQAIPTGIVRKDGYGNIRGTYVVEMLSYLRLFSETGYSMNRSRTKKMRAGPLRFFVVKPGMKSPLQPGIYEVRGSKSIQVIMFKHVGYRAIFPLFKIETDFTQGYFINRLSERLSQFLRGGKA